MSIALFLLTFLFPPRPLTTSVAVVPPVVAHMSARSVSFERRVAAPTHLPSTLPSYTVTATVYNAEPSQTDAEPFVTADNSRISRHHTSKNRWMALSRDMLKSHGGKFDYGDSITVSGISPALDGNYVVHDTMNRRYRHRIDLLVNRHEALYDEWVRFGKWDKVKISKVNPAKPAVWQAS
ncbi:MULTISPECIES: RlpA-like double-psi beta-barrel domain-containing protein [Hymenobacter]|uniref:3D domain-containing protein n=1 Tax=Hymenobacter jejuensis TaxID=2502781 RepID=A0A5B8A061_9BACT|nr:MULTISPECIES: hypothetical protein [Hymenobacter]MBC6991175.1 hypothetical protein [Hymenobacter sp. BT491]QDA60449.1 hypothetical protein FHG12_10155 [Hymenobacter jejuensis]